MNAKAILKRLKRKMKRLENKKFSSSRIKLRRTKANDDKNKNAAENNDSEDGDTATNAEGKTESKVENINAAIPISKSPTKLSKVNKYGKDKSPSSKKNEGTPSPKIKKNSRLAAVVRRKVQITRNNERIC